MWRNWQTRQIQVLVVATLCGFKSHHPHHKIKKFKNLIVGLSFTHKFLSAKVSNKNLVYNAIWLLFISFIDYLKTFYKFFVKIINECFYIKQRFYMALLNI